jgi:NTE family protein
MDKSQLKPAHLRRIKSLALLDTSQLESFLDYVELLHCPQSQTLFREGQPGDSMFLILEGQFRVYFKQRNGEVIFLRMLDAGEAFGEIALLNQVPRSASIEATKPSLLIKISAASLKRLVSEQPALAARFLYHLSRTLGRQLSDLTKKLQVTRELASSVSFLE